MPRFAPGDAVMIACRYPGAHHRVPNYVKGKTGLIERVCPAFGQPETLARGLDGKPFQTLYRVRLRQIDLWNDYTGSACDTLEIEIFEHWLEPASAYRLERCRC